MKHIYPVQKYICLEFFALKKSFEQRKNSYHTVRYFNSGKGLFKNQIRIKIHFVLVRSKDCSYHPEI